MQSQGQSQAEGVVWRRQERLGWGGGGGKGGAGRGVESQGLHHQLTSLGGSKNLEPNKKDLGFCKCKQLLRPVS